MTEDDARPDLPGSTTPPVEGVRWVWVKLGAWGVAIGLILLVAFVAAVALHAVFKGVSDGADRVVAALHETSEAGNRDDLLEVRKAQIATSPAAPTEAVTGAGADADVGQPVTWTLTPRPVFPRQGVRANIEAAAVVLECQALISGRAGACRIVSEDPAGYGFGEAAVSAMRDARLKPAEVDGIPVERPFRFTILFRLT